MWYFNIQFELYSAIRINSVQPKPGKFGGCGCRNFEGVAFTECILGLYADAERHLHMGIEAASQMPDDWEWVQELKGRLRLIDGHLQLGRFQEVDAQFDTWRAFTLRRCKLTKVRRIKLGDG
ncbi:MAG: hypothetical protein HC888_06655 [Candidatus Competibacteraceae bacterium]|nr:hypothetical protein [Candidatus Competibacteraceae bacterium]